MDLDDIDLDAKLEAAVRRVAATYLRRYLPFLAVAAFALLIIAFVPSVAPNQGTAAFGTSNSQPGAAGGGAAGPSSVSGAGGGSAAPGAAAATSGAPSVASGSGPGSLGAGQVGTSSQGASGSGAASSSAVASRSGGASDVAVSGVRCGPGVRQVPWSSYAPYCVPAFHGNNGGVTAAGVTPTAINVSFRVSDSGEAGAVEAIAGPALNTTQAQYLADLETYVGLFNKQFELYGRHVVIKPFTGQGDWVQEYQGQDLAAAQADAQTAKSLNAFADASTIAEVSTPPYTQDLADEHIIGIGGVSASQNFFMQEAPYAYSVEGTVTNLADFYGSVVCQRMAGLPAIFAGDPTFKLENRKFGLIYPDNPDFATAGKLVEQHLAACGVKLANTDSYSIDIPTLEEQDSNIIAQMHAAGVTTIICVCDLLSPNFLTTAADGQDYYPEWLNADGGDAYGQTYRQDQWSHVIVPGGTTPVLNQTEAYRAYKLADPSGEPQEQYYYLAYEVALQLFDALQAAGPDLTPYTFERAMFSLPSSAPGAALGLWSFGLDHFTTIGGVGIGYWDPNRTSGMNGKAGTYVSCSGADGQNHPFWPPSAYGRAHTQLSCQ